MCKTPPAELRILFWFGSNLNARVDLVIIVFVSPTFRFYSAKFTKQHIAYNLTHQLAAFTAAFSFLSLFIDYMSTHYKISTIDFEDIY